MPSLPRRGFCRSARGWESARTRRRLRSLPRCGKGWHGSSPHQATGVTLRRQALSMLEGVSRVKVLISAYACEPGKGSEPGAGWNWSLAAARDNEVWVLTRANNRAAIETELAQRPQPSLTFVYVDLPSWARRWKRGQRGVRLYYSLWQVAAFREAKRLHAEIHFDLVHHVTFANAWLPALVGFVDAPFVLGPVDAGMSVPITVLPRARRARSARRAEGRERSSCSAAPTRSSGADCAAPG